METILYDRIIEVTLKQMLVEELTSAPSKDDTFIDDASTSIITRANYRKGKPNQGKIMSFIFPNSSFFAYDRGSEALYTGNPGSQWVHRNAKAYTEDVQGNKLYNRVVYREGNVFVEQGVKYRARGKTYEVSSIDDLRTGMSSTGTWYKKGDIVIVKAKGNNPSTMWCVIESPSKEPAAVRKISQDVDAEGNFVEQFLASELEYHIECPENGMKPDISFSTSLIPGQNCYSFSLKIRNMVIGGYDIRSWDTMVVKAGYRLGDMVTFDCPIFSSYIESPNPDGLTVFEGITVGQVGNVMRQRPIDVRITEENTTMLSLIEGIGAAIGSNVIIEHSLPKGYSLSDVAKSGGRQLIRGEKAELETIPWMLSTGFKKGTSFYFNNAMQALSWLQNWVGSTVEYYWPNTYFVIQLVGDKLKVFWINGGLSEKESSFADEVVSLECVSSVSYTGVAVTVKAIWDPRLLPGDIFYMPPTFYNGLKLPNTLKKEEFTNINNLYRTIKMDIRFSTVSSENEMTLLAVPAQYMSQSKVEGRDEMSSEEIKAMCEEYFAKNMDEEGVVLIGGGGTMSSFDKGVIEKNNVDNRVIANNSGLEAQLAASFTTLSTLDIQPGMGTCLSLICRFFYWEYSQGPLMNKHKRGTGKDCGYFQVKKDTLAEVGKKYWYPDGIQAWIVFMPLVANLTFWRFVREGEPWDEIDPNNINIIHKRRRLFMPIINDFMSLSVAKDIYKDAFKQYWGSEDMSGWAHDWRTCYYYLGGTEVL